MIYWEFREGLKFFRSQFILLVRYHVFIDILFRPKWDATTTAEQLQQKEREEFLEWRRKLALFQEETDLLLTPYEKNLDFWRQLWRVVERWW